MKKQNSEDKDASPQEDVYSQYAEYEKKKELELKAAGSSSVVEDLKRQVEWIDSEIRKIQLDSSGLNKKMVQSIANDINITLKTIGNIDETAKDILEHQDKIRDSIQILENQNRLDEARNIRDMALLKFYKFFEKTITMHTVLRNELEQLQSKIRQA